MAIFAMATGLIIGFSNAEARNTGAPGGSEPAWHECQKAASDVIPAIDAARHVLGQGWLPHRETYFAAYTMPGETRSPFDLSPREPASGPTHGFVEARPPHCIYRTLEGTEPSHLVRFISPFYRFHEDGHGWSPPLRSGLMLEATVTRVAAEWQANVPPTEKSILLPEQKPQRPDATKLPGDAAWAQPIPGCAKRQKWNGIDCIPRGRR